MTLSEALAWGRAALAGGESPAIDTQLLLMQATGVSRTALLAFGDRPLSPEQQAAFEAAIARRQAGEPVAHILGEQEFYGLALEVTPHTLIPRPDTETLVDLALALPEEALRFLDLGTGTGAIAIAIAHHRPRWQGVAIDRVAEAAALAARNVARHQVAVEVLAGSWFEPVAGKRFGLILSNPPYIDPVDPHLGQGDVRFEPLSALIAEEAGLADLKHIIEQAPAYLQSPGWLMLEHGYDQGQAVRELMQLRGFVAVRTQHDLGGQERVTLGRWQDN
ncbi:peptide chain release factor N(5)-glutamine methyltransferase [Gallaecimonas kandeliae]|uniref:peptide chain release factor N(5)-glutamine methyltransferase n=1 Tax=Gallaecimonas kandeliae TaxID=3029055 RepID=UPI002648EE4D|nr:peptide chain release factor N(5)-glutamine methyltransferase [Gallaecimonas kandeliae]WKE64599.1 peptide chain release factor N(5)-glutamine methyltransferase [Gallaecimonas kandeliae]